MLRPWHVWSSFAACLALVAIALAWLSFHAIQLDRAEAVARRQVAVEDDVRLALWRMDSAMATLVAQESARPSFAYQPFYGQQLPAKGKSAQKASRLPSPLLTETTPLVRLHFEIDASGQLRSPRNPTGEEQKIAVPEFLSKREFLDSQL